MKKGMKKHTANSVNFNTLQMLRNCIKDEFEVFNVKWGGHWNGMNWEYFTFFAKYEEFVKITSFCENNRLNIELS